MMRASKGDAEMVSVIIPVYNNAETIDRCVSSLLNQSCEDLQILLIDDGSTDGSAGKCDGFAARDARIAVLHQPNGGASCARNAGLRLADGEYVTFMDADDYVEPEHISSLIGLINKYRCDVAVCSYTVEREGRPASNAHASLDERLYDHDSAVCEVLAGGAVGGYCCNKLYRRELLEGLSFDSEIQLLEDLSFNYRVLKGVNSMAFADNGTYHYVQHEVSATHNTFGESHRRMVETARSIRAELEGEGGDLAEAGRGLLSTTILWVADVMAENGPYDSGLFAEYQAEFKPLAVGYLKFKRAPLSHRMSGVFFLMGYRVYKLSVKAARRLLG